MSAECLGVLWEDDKPQNDALRILEGLKASVLADLDKMTLEIAKGGTPQEMRLMLDAHRVLQAEYDGLKNAAQRCKEATNADRNN